MASRKGLSELIAIVFAVAFVVALAVLLSGFLTSFTQEQTSKVRQEGQATVDCSIAAVDIDQDTVTLSNETLKISVENTGRTDLTDVDVTFRNDTDAVFQTADLNESLASGELKTLEIDSFLNPVDRIIVKSGCPGITDTVENVSGSFEEVTD